MAELERLLSKGLQEGYAGGATKETIKRGTFELESSQYLDAPGIYRDEWSADRTGGGQELASIMHSDLSEEKITRVYAGGTISHEQLEQLGLTKKDVTKYLKRKIQELGEKTRLYENCVPEPDNKWQYSYSVTSSLPEIPLTVGMEIISYMGQMVFAHGFLLSPIE